MTKIIKCSCNHDFQDNTYGKGNRVANWAVKKTAWRCTVCAKEQIEVTGPRKK
jgi:hypothetical protein